MWLFVWCVEAKYVSPPMPSIPTFPPGYCIPYIIYVWFGETYVELGMTYTYADGIGIEGIDGVIWYF